MSRYCQTLQCSGKIIYLLLLHYYLLDLHNKIKLLPPSPAYLDIISIRQFHMFHSIYSLLELYILGQFPLLITNAHRIFHALSELLVSGDRAWRCSKLLQISICFNTSALVGFTLYLYTFYLCSLNFAALFNQHFWLNPISTA